MSKEVGMSRKSRGKGDTPPGTKGARRATGESGGALRPGQRWSAGRKRDVVLRVLRGPADRPPHWAGELDFAD
jgi:hypothetical protein